MSGSIVLTDPWRCVGLPRELIAIFASASEPVDVPRRDAIPEPPFPRPPRKRGEMDDSSADEGETYSGDVRLISGPLRTAALGTKAPKG